MIKGLELALILLASALFVVVLFRRLNLPPLRSCKADLRQLTPLFVQEYNAKAAKRVRHIPDSAWQRLEAHDWPGNARELRNIIRRAVALADGVIDAGMLALDAPFTESGCELRLVSRAADAPSGPLGAPTTPHGADVQGDTLSLAGKTFAEMQNAIFRWALGKSSGSRRRAAATLGISRSTFCDRIRRLGLATG